MKKILLLIMAFAGILSCAGCSDSDDSGGDDSYNGGGDFSSYGLENSIIGNNKLVNKTVME